MILNLLKNHNGPIMKRTIKKTVEYGAKNLPHPEDVLYQYVDDVINLGSVVDAFFDYSSQVNGWHSEQLEIKSETISQPQSTLTQKDQRISELERERAWISVEDRLPEKQGKYLVYKYAIAGAVTCTFCFYEDKWQWIGTDYIKTITHWMPLQA
jgi:hypothetical protein